MEVMTQVSRPLIALLLATVVFFAVWMVALKPKSGGGSSGNSAPLQSAIDKAHQAVAKSNAASVAHGGTVATTPSAATTPTTPAATTPATTTPAATTPAKATVTKSKVTKTTSAAGTKVTKSTTSVTVDVKAGPRTAAEREAVVNQALRADKVIALLFFNYRAADDREVKRELATVPTHGGLVVKMAVPLAEVARYKYITQQLPVTSSPTLIIIDRAHEAWNVVGYASGFEIRQRVADAVAVPAK